MVTLNETLVRDIKNLYEEVELNLDNDYRSLFISDKSKVEIETMRSMNQFVYRAVKLGLWRCYGVIEIGLINLAEKG